MSQLESQIDGGIFCRKVMDPAPGRSQFNSRTTCRLEGCSLQAHVHAQVYLIG